MNAHGRPVATYRLQLHQHFRFEDAKKLVPYLSRLGVTHLYCSPILRARAGSTHGYDVVDPKTINPDLGDETDFRAMVGALRAYGMGLIVDIVPNHMAASSTENPYWHELLMYGRCAPHAHWFDVDWRWADPEMWGRVLVPILGGSLSHVLSNDQLCVAWRDGRFVIRYFGHVFPLDPATVPAVFRFGLSELQEQLASDHPAIAELEVVLRQLAALPRRTTRMRSQTTLPIEQIELWLSQLTRIIASSPQLEQWATRTAARFAEGHEGRVRLRKLLQAQNYRLVYWRRAATAINYRRFFDISDLVSLRQEDPQVFAETHETIGRWIQEGWVDGLRVDHLDGLRDPRDYVHRLHQLLAAEDPSGYPRLLLVEKILAHDEELRSCWPVAGTTGYDFLNQVESVLVSPHGFREIETDYRRLLRRPVEFRQFVARGKRRVLRHDLSAYVGRLADTLVRLARDEMTWETDRPQVALVESASAGPADGPADAGPAPSASPGAGEYRPRQLTKRQLADALLEVAVAMRVYRTYVDNRAELHADDRRFLAAACAAVREDFRVTPDAIDFVENVLLLHKHARMPEHVLQQHLNFIQRFQQLTGPAAAKGLEDTALYDYVPLAARNEVGGEPDTPLEHSVATLHARNSRRAAIRPSEMLCVTTHDTKRTADVRARLDVLSELPRLWQGYVKRWRRLNRGHRRRVRGKIAPDTVAEYLFYQSVIGIWPAPDPRRSPLEFPADRVLSELCERLEQYMLKAIREAKVRTSWVNGDQQFEEAVMLFVRGCFRTGTDAPNPFLSDVNSLVGRIARPGFWNSISRTLIQYTSPGTPDLYQGDELWNLALVDPDNRRAVDYPLRQCLLDAVVLAMEAPLPACGEFVRELLESAEDGRIKLHVIHALLRARSDHPELFAHGSYLPLEASGPHRDHLVVFARTFGNQAVVVAAPRFTAGLVDAPADAPIGTAVWSDDDVVPLPETLRGYAWKSVLTREATEHFRGPADSVLAVSRLLSQLPGAVLVGQRAQT